MTINTDKDYWISSSALYIELNALGNPDYIQASTIGGAKILVYVKDIISYDAGHNYRRWSLQASPTVFGDHAAKYVYAAIPRDMQSTSPALIVFPSERIDIYGKNVAEEQIGSTDYYYIFLQGIVSGSGDNGTVSREWKQRISTGYLSSDEALAASTTESPWYNYSSVDGIVTFLKDLTMKAGTFFHDFFAKYITVKSGGSIKFEDGGELTGVADDTTDPDAPDKVVTADYLEGHALSSTHDDTANGNITFVKNTTTEGTATFADALVDTIQSKDFAEEAYRGFAVRREANGNYKLSIADLDVWGKASFNQLEIRRVSYAGGTVIYSNAGSTLKRVVAVTDKSGATIAYKCYAVADDGETNTMNFWTVGMMAMCQTFNLQEYHNEGAAQNRYYWRLCVGKGQEYLEDGKMYDYILLSNLAEFSGGDDSVVPLYTERCFAREDGRVIIFGSVAVSVRGKSTTSFAEGCDVTKDDSGTPVASRVFYGYAAGSDAPAEGDVIVQVGDQVSWSAKGNLIKMSTYGDENVPCIIMYHDLGAPYKNGSSVNPFQWKKVTHILSPKYTLMNSDCFYWFSGDDPSDIISPVTESYDIVPSSSFIRKSTDGTASPADITLTLLHHTGGKVSADTTMPVYINATFGDKRVSDAIYTTSVLTTLQQAGCSSLDDVTALSAFVRAGGVVMAQTDIAVLSDGANGSSVTIKGTLKDTSKLADIVNPQPGDGYIISGNLWVYTGDGSVYGFENVGQVKGDKGDPGNPGNPGNDALDIVTTGTPLTYESDADGRVTDFSPEATIRVMKAGADCTSQCAFSVADTLNCSASVSAGTVKLTAITQVSTAYGAMSAQAGFVSVRIMYGGNTYYAQIPFVVDIVKMSGGLKSDCQSLSSQYTSLSADVSKKADSDKVASDLKQMSSELTQTARSISLSVSAKTAGRRNMLQGSACRMNGEGWTYMAGTNASDFMPYERIERLTGIDGTNCLHVRTASSVTAGFHWNGASTQGNVKIEKGKKYTLSFWGRLADKTAASFYLETIWSDSPTNSSRPAGYSGPSGTGHAYTPDNNGTWQLFTETIEIPSDAAYEYIEVCLFAHSMGSAIVEGYICRPMMEEGDTYNGWSLADNDDDYVGGNLLDNSRTLTRADNLTIVDGTTDEAGYGDCTSIHAEAVGNYVDMLQWDVQELMTAPDDFMFSFYAKGNGTLAASLYPTDGSYTLTEASNGTQTVLPDGRVGFTLTQKWQRYWVHWSPKNPATMPLYCLLRAEISCAAYIACPKLERGATLTEYTERASDMVNRQTLKKAGIDISASDVTLYGEKVIIRNQNGVQSAMFDSDGSFNSSLVKATRLETSGSDSARVSIEDGIISVFGKAGIANIRFGVNDDGMAVLSYFNDAGQRLYDLGPNGIDAGMTREAKVTDVSVGDILKALGVAALSDLCEVETTGELKGSLVVKRAYRTALFGPSIDSLYYSPAGFHPSCSTKKYARLYSCGYLNKTPLPDKERGLATAELALKADGRFFASSPFAESDSLANLFTGTWLRDTSLVRTVRQSTEIAEQTIYSISFSVFTDGVESGRAVYCRSNRPL